MKTICKIRITILLYCILSSIIMKGQFSVSKLTELWRVKSGITYIVVKDPDSLTAEYIDVFKKYWTVSEFKFIKYAERMKYREPGNCFFMIGDEDVAYGGYIPMNGHLTPVGIGKSHIYFELWTITEDQYKDMNKRRGLENEDKTQLARIELFLDYQTFFSKDKINEYGIDGGGHIRNWGPGILKNYLQLLMMRIDAAEKHLINEEISNINELKKLQTEILYVPDYVLIKFDKMQEDELKRHNEKELFEGYKFKYQLLSTAELNKKILNDEEGFYYLIYVKSDTHKYINVINSLTGDIIYAMDTPNSHNIKPKDLSALCKKIKQK